MALDDTPNNEWKTACIVYIGMVLYARFSSETQTFAQAIFSSCGMMAWFLHGRRLTEILHSACRKIKLLELTPKFTGIMYSLSWAIIFYSLATRFFVFKLHWYFIFVLVTQYFTSFMHEWIAEIVKTSSNLFQQYLRTPNIYHLRGFTTVLRAPRSWKWQPLLQPE